MIERVSAKIEPVTVPLLVTLVSFLVAAGRLLGVAVSVLADGIDAAVRALGAVLVSAFATLLMFNDKRDGAAGLSRTVLRPASRLLPSGHRDRYWEEWCAELADLRGLERLRHACGLLTRAPLVSWELRHQALPRRGRHQFVLPVKNIVGVEGWVAGAALMERDKNDRIRYRLQYARRQDDEVRIVVLTRYSKDDSAGEITALLNEAVTLGRVTRKAVRRKARLVKKVDW